jgi:DNA-binding transcriptional ArsR family regulator
MKCVACLTRGVSDVILNHMVEYHDTRLDAVFSALADPTRRAMLVRLREGRATVSELAEPHDVTIQAISKHLKKLEAAGLVSRRKEGREVRCELEIDPMRRASSWIEEQRRFWELRLDRLEALLGEGATSSETRASADADFLEWQDENQTE